MIGVFFELFKTPWEWQVPTKQYHVVIGADGRSEAAHELMDLSRGRQYQT